MIRLSPVEALKVAVIGFVLVYGWYIWDSRQDALAKVVQLEDKIKLQADMAAADAARKAAAYAEAKRKADNEAKHLQARVAWLQKQTPKGCEDAARIIHEYRARK
jgi:aminoglycoside phosphotransferase (APT) family kinase protein